jgi:hypothetical protein
MRESSTLLGSCQLLALVQGRRNGPRADSERHLPVFHLAFLLRQSWLPWVWDLFTMVSQTEGVGTRHILLCLVEGAVAPKGAVGKERRE